MTNPDIYGNYLSVEDCAKDMGLDHTTVWKFIKDGKLPATNVGNGNYRPIYGVLLEDLNLFKKQYIKYYSDTRGNSIKKTAKRKKDLKESENKKKKDDEIASLKKEIKDIYEKLFELTVRMEELTK